ncbi:colicin V biosynthesis protein [Roseibium aquae]|uniref:Colicin V biosynthesis protein n=1 Tax=Roseibium aquae TaxID=1323746 RepID=A0A916TH72_9HYPH|nr:CvpA family protein [Roseibium aquae]GGB42951.1 colicin V biosynthesis protein [Roseibium aquae]
MPITLLDGILLAIMLVSAFLAMIRGFVREVLSIASWVAAAAAAFFLYDRVLPYIQQYIPNEMVAIGASVAAVFLVTLLVVSYITMRISDFVLDSRIGALDRTMGFVFGAVRGMLLVVVAMMFFNWFVQPEQQPGWVLEAKSRPILLSIGERLVSVLPEDPEQDILDRLKGESTGARSTGPAPIPEETAYSDSERQALDQLTSGTNQ